MRSSILDIFIGLVLLIGFQSGPPAAGSQEMGSSPGSGLFTKQLESRSANKPKVDGLGPQQSKAEQGTTEVPVVPSASSDIRPATQHDWYPADVDGDIPEVQPGATCPESEVLTKAGERIRELTDNANKFTATEIVEHQSVKSSGQLRSVETRKFNYLVSIEEKTGGLLNVEEYRNGGSAPDQFPDHVASVGTPSLVLIFHPAHAPDFQMICEGLGEWHGHPAWQVHFQEIPDTHHSISALIINGRVYELLLRGRAWILADSFQVARLESDLASAIPKIRLRLQHQDIEYHPVKFSDEQGEVWLPAISKLYMEFGKHRFYRVHRFTEFRHFSVTVHQTIGKLKY